MVQNENTTLVIYEVINADNDFVLELLPIIAARGYHALQNSLKNIFWDVQFQNGIFKNQPYEGAPHVYISVPGSTYQHHPRWFYKFNYLLEKYRGLDYEEDLFNHGTISVKLKNGDKLGIIISTEDPSKKNAELLFEKERERKRQLIGKLTDQPSGLPIAQKLSLAADQFIVKRDADLKTIIAGYHWFTDWGRDTMIALPGLCLTTGRYNDAKKILATFAKNVSMGMLPNRFQDGNDPPEYNNVDGTLWYFISIYKYLQHTNDRRFVLETLLPVLKNIIDWHFKGTRYNIHVDSDGLLYAGEKGQQLTWMDARIGDWVVTPRMGKPVEIQALWYNSLKIFAEFLKLNGESSSADVMNQYADKAKKSFLEKFWFADGNYLYDVIDENGNPDSSLRPNQLFAASLPYALIDEEKTAAILKTIEKKLYTPVGLRTLPGDDPRYICVYSNNGQNKDACYHQGTVWSWLLGPYVDAIMKAPRFIGADGLSGKELAKKLVENFKYHLDEACKGTVSEIFDADPPNYPRGCVAQAWSVGEILRVIKEYKLEQKISRRALVNKPDFTRF
jgi:predicted glycogen debranching enzyme